MTSAYPLGKTDWAEGQIRATWGVIGASGAPSGFAEIELAEVLHPQIIQESRKGDRVHSLGGTPCLLIAAASLPSGPAGLHRLPGKKNGKFSKKYLT